MNAQNFEDISLRSRWHLGVQPDEPLQLKAENQKILSFLLV